MEEPAALPFRARRRRRWVPSWSGIIGIGLVGSAILVALIGPLVAPHDVGLVVDMDAFGPISATFPLGTDYLGRDMLSRVLVGARYTVGIAFLATSLAACAGLGLGLLAAVLGGWRDALLSRTLDALSAIPSKMLALVLVAGLGSSILALVGVMAFIYTPGCYRITRSLAVNIAAEEFVLAARLRGEGKRYIMLREIMPNMIGPILTDFGLRFVFVVLLLSSLSFLGLGVQPPDSDWGSLVRENIAGLSFGAAAVLMPAFAIGLLTIGGNLVIDTLATRRGTGSGQR